MSETDDLGKELANMILNWLFIIVGFVLLILALNENSEFAISIGGAVLIWIGVSAKRHGEIKGLLQNQ